MNQDADAPDMASPSALVLMQDCISQDATLGNRQQRKKVFVVDVVTPAADGFGIVDVVLDEKPLMLRHGAKELQGCRFVAGLERTKRAVQTALQRNVPW